MLLEKFRAGEGEREKEESGRKGKKRKEEQVTGEEKMRQGEGDEIKLPVARSLWGTCRKG
jgi:hypothetical protein